MNIRGSHECRPFTLEQQAQCFSRSNALFSAGCQVTADATKYLGAVHRSEAARHLLLDLDHAKIILCLVVGKGHEWFDHEAEHGILKFSEPLQEISRF